MISCIDFFSEYVYFILEAMGKTRGRWKNNIKMDLQDVRGGRADWMELAQDRDRWRALVGTIRDLRVP